MAESIVIILIIWWMYRRRKNNRKKYCVTALGVPGDPKRDTCQITLEDSDKYLTRLNIGGFVGYVIPETSNSQDSRAIAVYDRDRLKIGYIPTADLDWFGDWSDHKKMPCVGIICKRDGHYVVNAEIIRPCSADFVYKTIQDYFLSIEPTYGKKFVAKEIRLNIQPPAAADTVDPATLTAPKSETIDREALRDALVKIAGTPRNQPDSPTFDTYIAGANMYCTKDADVGAFAGIVIPEPDNEHDPGAMAVYRDGKKIGYIPARHLDSYNNWRTADRMPCMGVIYPSELDYKDYGDDDEIPDNLPPLHTGLYVLQPDSPDLVVSVVQHYFDDIIAPTYGDDYIPDKVTFGLVDWHDLGSLASKVK